MGSRTTEKGEPRDNQEDIFPVFINEQTARVPVHGSVPRPFQKQVPNRESKLPEILDKLKDPNFSLAEVTRLIAAETTLIAQDIRTCESDGAAAFKRKNSMGQITALRALAETAKAADAWAKRDVLNFDGPKFKFALGKIAGYFKEAALKALRGDKSTVNSIMRHWGDILAVHELELRRETEKIGYGTDAPSAHLHSQELNEPHEFFKGKNLQCPETPPTGQLASKPTTENGAPDNATAHHSERSDYDELENGTELPFTGLMDSPGDRALAKAEWESIERGQESDYDVEPPSDLGTKPKDATPPGPSEDDI